MKHISDNNGVVCMRSRALAEAAVMVRGAENFTLKSQGQKKSKKAKFKSLAEGTLMLDRKRKLHRRGVRSEWWLKVCRSETR